MTAAVVVGALLAEAAAVWLHLHLCAQLDGRTLRRRWKARQARRRYLRDSTRG